LNLVLGSLSHRVQGAAILEPFNLGLIKGMKELDVEGLAVFGVHNHSNRLSHSELSSKNINLYGV
jgi:hypothetical protein